MLQAMAELRPVRFSGLPGQDWSRLKQKKKRRCSSIKCSASKIESPKLVTFLGKGGVGKTSCAVLAAQFYASIGLRTCLVVQSQDVTAEFLLDQPLKYSPPVTLNDGLLTAFRLESTKVLSEPMEQLKKADNLVGFSQGAIQEVAGDELSVLPGMDSILALFLMERLTGFSGIKPPRTNYDVVVYDGVSSEETLRMFGSAERSRWYLNRFRSIAEKTDIGRVVLPSIIRLAEASLLEDSTRERSTSELWEQANKILRDGEEWVLNPKKFSSYIVTDPRSKLAEKMALRYWGCAMQAGVHVAGFFHRETGKSDGLKLDQYNPLGVCSVPQLGFEAPPRWEQVVAGLNEETRRLLEGNDSISRKPVQFDVSARSVTCFLPGFDKSEVKLTQPSRSQLLVEAGDQRRVISLPAELQGKVKGAKFQEKSLIVLLSL